MTGFFCILQQPKKFPQNASFERLDSKLIRVDVSFWHSLKRRCHLGVNFINILRTPFLYESQKILAAFLQLHVSRKKLREALMHEKICP